MCVIEQTTLFGSDPTNAYYIVTKLKFQRVVGSDCPIIKLDESGFVMYFFNRSTGNVVLNVRGSWLVEGRCPFCLKYSRIVDLCTLENVTSTEIAEVRHTRGKQ